MDNEVTNFYTRIDKKYIKKYHNPAYKNHLIELPMRGLIIGSSGSMKTNLALEIIKRMNGTFEFLILCCKSRHEPLYEWLADKLKDRIVIYENGEVPSIEELKEFITSQDVEIPTTAAILCTKKKKLKKQTQALIIFDDLVLSKQDVIADYYIRGRKFALSMLYISQSYYKVPKIIRLNINYMFIKKLSSKRDLKLILSEYNLGVEIKELEAYYIEATKDKTSFFMIDIDNDATRFRKNFLQVFSR